MNFPIKVGSETRITLTGKLDFARAPELMDALVTLKGEDISTIIFECKELSYISSSGIRVIIFAKQKIAPHMKIIMENVCDDILEILDMCGISDFLEFETSK